MRRRVPCLLALVVVGCTVLSARAEEDPLQVEPGREALEEIALLRARGGHLAVPRLEVLLRRGDTDVRRATLDALAHVGLRTERAAESVRRALATIDVDEREAALHALGLLGDGRDLEALLGALHEEDPGLSATALKALRRLTGRRLPVSPTRCALWWRSSAKGLRRAVSAALDGVGHADTDRRLDAALETLVRDGWVDLPAVTEAARGWMRGSNHRLRAAGLRVAAALRLADLAGDVEGLLPFVSEEDAQAGARAARALGVSLERLPPVWRRRLGVEAAEAR